MKNFNLEFDYNSPIIITYLIISVIACILNFISRGKSNKILFTSYRSSIFNPLTYVRLITHSIGHSDFNHLTSNFLYILLIGPMIEEKYGSTNLLVMLIITSIIIAIFNDLISNYVITGASGNVYMLITLSSFSNFSEGKIPITLILIFIFYIFGEINKSFLQGNKKIYHDGHIIGAVCGIAFGFLLLHYPNIFIF